MFTIIIPTHERPLLLQRTLESLIAQTYTDFKVIIVSDSASYLPPYQHLLALQGRYVYIVRSGVNGPAESRNMALAIADSKYVMFLDDDDTFEPGHLQALADKIGSASPELLFCDFKVRYEDRTTNPPAHLSTEDISIAPVTQDSVYVRNRIPNSCLVYRRDVIADIRYDSDLIIYEDWQFLLACLDKRTLRHVSTNGVVIHKSQATAPENMRRGNTRDDKIVEVMLELYKRYPAPNTATKKERQALMATAGVTVALEAC